MKTPTKQWLLVFEDPERGICLFNDETEARAFYAEASINWNCTLFVPVEEMDRRLKDAAGPDTF